MRVALGLLGIVLSGCTVGPDYDPPKSDLPALYAEAAAQGGLPVGQPTWWRQLGDPVLDYLMQTALQSAPGLAEAAARVREARALAGIAGADQLPQIDVLGEYRRSHGSDKVPTGVSPGGLGPDKNSNLWQVGFDASWELDIFGGERRRVEAADADYQARLADRDAVELSLLAEVARNYLKLRAAQRETDVARQNLAIEQDALSLAQVQFTAGLAGSLDILQAQAQVSDTEARIPNLDSDAHAAAFRIGALIGQLPEDLKVLLSASAPIPQTMPDVPVGLPSDLLRRRPDIRAAERRLAAETARIGVAEADFYPHFSLTGIGGFQSLQLGSTGSLASGYFSLGPNIRWNVFDAGRVRLAVEAEQAKTDAAAAVYRRTVLDALSEVETALVAYGKAEERRISLAAEVGTNRQAVTVATRLYRQGLNDFLWVLDAERSLANATYALVESDRDTALAFVALDKALGGGW